MKLEEIKALLPKDAEIIEFNPDARYLITFKRGSTTEQAMVAALRYLGDNGVKAFAVVIYPTFDSPVTVHEIVP